MAYNSGSNILSLSAPTGLLSIHEFLLVIIDLTNPNASCSLSINANSQISISNNIYSYQIQLNPQMVENQNFNLADTMKLAIFAINSIGVSPVSNIIQIN